MVADLQKKLSIPCELKDVCVFHSVSADPDIFFVVDEDTVLGIWPLVLRAWPTPSLNDISCRVKFKNRWRWSTAIGPRRVGCGIFVVVVQTSGARRDPEMIV